ncbi:X-Pro dipeptidyl-peptidase-like protein [Solirubrobacter pauli]|uniref:Xaa-Pro dipeptidyl-peptidase n=1 Tax=Solirubrobacter pauli TaxID=166793 RepID=A0A660LAZ4_9ACTN|nr:Xaa-Pro dipeptidyl-peptidase [Solirubrobacter pauli]RKQ92182.1 X-Pro dipeptidyl-peptidase-like protein [Solirubrobacter pauli]
MEFGKRLAKASAFTVTAALAGVVATSSAGASPLPPKTTAASAAVPSALAAPAPAVPTFVNGMSQAVFASGEANWVNEDLWVELDVDTDGDGKKDRVHTDVSRPMETNTDGLKVPVIFEDSPYYAGGPDQANWAVDHEIGFPPAFRPLPTNTDGRAHTSRINTIYESTWVPRGYAVVHAESPGSGSSTGCPNSGAPIETLGATGVIEWLNGKRKAYTTRDGSVEAAPVTWHNGNTAMMGTSYNGTLPIAAASTGVEGLKAIVPISAISDWYDYYRANGAVKAPGGYQGEDLDVLTEYVYTRWDENGKARAICRPLIEDLKVKQDRVTGNRSAFWDERNYMKDVRAGKLKAATLIAHGGNDFNVMTKHAAQLYDELKKQNIPHQFYFHQGGHGGAPPDYLVNLWFTKYLWNQDNGVQNLPKSWVVRTDVCPPRQSTVATDVTTPTATLTVADASVFSVGQTLTIPQTNPTATVTRVITNIAGNTLTLASNIAATQGQRVAAGTVVNLVCGNPNPTPYAEWPDPASSDAVLKPGTGGAARGSLTVAANPATGTETLSDDARQTASTLMNAATEDSRLLYVTNPLTKDVRISGTPKVNIKAAFSKPKANLTAILVSLPATGSGTILTRGWIDAENRNSDYVTDAVTPGTFYDYRFQLMAKDIIVPAGRRLGLMVLSSDNEFTVRPAPGTEVSVDLAGTSLSLPVVGGAKAFANTIGGDVDEETGLVGGTVPATLALTLGTPGSFGAFTPGLAKEYTATTDAIVTSTAGDATLTVADTSANKPGYLVNGAFSLPQPLQGLGVVKTWNAPTSNEKVAVTLKQAIGEKDALRTGSYSKTLTFTLSTTTP